MAFFIWFVNDQHGNRVAAFAHAEDSARFIGGCNDYTVTRGPHTVWTEGCEDFSAAESFDLAATRMQARFESGQERRAFDRAFAAVRSAVRA